MASLPSGLTSVVKPGSRETTCRKPPDWLLVLVAAVPAANELNAATTTVIAGVTAVAAGAPVRLDVNPIEALRQQ